MRLLAAGVPVYFDPVHEHTAVLIADSIERTADVLARRWQLPVPTGVVVHVLLDGPAFVLASAPSAYRHLLKLTKGLWRGRVDRLFPLVGGWTIPWPGRPAVGVKPPELMARSDASLGDQLFEAVPDLDEKVRRVAAHEFTHACTARLRLPMWQNEGVAMRAVDHVAGTPTVLSETRRLVAPDPGVFETREWRRRTRMDARVMLRLYATGYWTVRAWDESGDTVLRKR